MRVTKPVQVTKERLETIVCNKCSHIFDQSCVFGFNGAHSFEAHGSYGSKYPDDCKTIKFDLCGSCLKEFVDTFGIPVEVGSWV